MCMCVCVCARTCKRMAKTSQKHSLSKKRTPNQLSVKTTITNKQTNKHTSSPQVGNISVSVSNSVVLTFQTDHQGKLEVDGLASVGDAVGDGCTVNDATKDVDQDGLHLAHTIFNLRLTSSEPTTKI